MLQQRNSNKVPNPYAFLKGSIVAVCVLLFILNSYASFLDFIEGKTIQAVDIKLPPEKGLEPPAFVICKARAFKNRELNADLEEYNNNTLKLDDFLISATLTVPTPLKKGSRWLTTAILRRDITVVHTAFNGNCFSFNIRTPVCCLI